MTANPVDHAGLEVLPFDECLRLLATVPVGRVGFFAAGEVVMLPVNHAVDGSNVVFRTDNGSKLAHLSDMFLVGFEADSYNEDAETGWSVVITGRADIVDSDTEISQLDQLGLRPWGDAGRPYWIRIRPTSVTGRRTVASVPAG